MLDIARRADVAPGTVANHFGSAEALATEVTSRTLGHLRMPTAELFDGIAGVTDRIRLLVRLAHSPDGRALIGSLRTALRGA